MQPLLDRGDGRASLPPLLFRLDDRRRRRLAIAVDVEGTRVPRFGRLEGALVRGGIVQEDTRFERRPRLLDTAEDEVHPPCPPEGGY